MTATKTIEIVNLLNFVSFYNLVKDKSLPIKTSYKLHRIAKEAEKHIGFYQEQMNVIIKEYCETEENGEYKITPDGGYAIIEGKEEECSNKISELQKLEIEINDWNFSIDEFESISISPQDLFLIDSFIKE